MLDETNNPDQFNRIGSLSFEELATLYDNDKRDQISESQLLAHQISSSGTEDCRSVERKPIKNTSISSDGENDYNTGELMMKCAETLLWELYQKRGCYSGTKGRVLYLGTDPPPHSSFIINIPESSRGFLVIRGEGYCDQRATVSFGVDGGNFKFDNCVKGSQADHCSLPLDYMDNFYKAAPHDATKYVKVMDVTNHYKPSETKVRGFSGGESTKSNCVVNHYRPESKVKKRASVGDQPTSPYSYDMAESVVSSDNEGYVYRPRSRRDGGLFEVPVDICSLPRLVNPFKGFSKVYTTRAIKFLNFTKCNDRVICKLESSACRILSRQVNSSKVVSVGIVGDPKSGKSYLGSLLVGKCSKSFKISGHTASEDGTVWIYVAKYQDDFVYLFLDLDGFDSSGPDRIKMTELILLLVNSVLCNSKRSQMSGIYETVQAMINVTKGLVDRAEADTSSASDLTADSSSDASDIVELFRKKTTKLFLDDSEQSTSSLTSEDENKSLWVPPIIHFIFRDSTGYVKCIDERNYSPETLVEQGIFNNYLNIFDSVNDDDMGFKNDMLDAFEVFTNRKYTCLPYPVKDGPKDEESTGNIKQFLVNLLSLTADHRVRDGLDRTPLDNPGDSTSSLSTSLHSVPTTSLSNDFYKNLDEVKACVYQDVLSHSRVGAHLNGRMYVHYVKLLIQLFNNGDRVDVKQVNSVLRQVNLHENNNIYKDAVFYFLKHVKAKIVSKLPLSPKELLSIALNIKHKALQYFESNAYGTYQEYSKLDSLLSTDLDEMVRKLERKNESTIDRHLGILIEKRVDILDVKIKHENYTRQNLDADFNKLHELVIKKFSDPATINKALEKISQRLVDLFNKYHPELYINQLNILKHLGASRIDFGEDQADVDATDEEYQAMSTLLKVSSNIRSNSPVIVKEDTEEVANAPVPEGKTRRFTVAKRPVKTLLVCK